MLKATATFSFDRYICGESSSLARSLGIDLNNNASLTATARNNAYKSGNTELNRVMNSSLNLLNEGVAYRDLRYRDQDGLIRRRTDVSGTAFSLSGQALGPGIVNP